MATVKLSFSSIAQWFEIITKNRFQGGNKARELTIDYSICKKMNPFQIVSLAALIQEYYQNGVPIIHKGIEKLPAHISDYIASIKFENHWNGSTVPTEFVPSANSNSSNLWKLNANTIDSYVSEAGLHFKNKFLNNRATTPLNLCLAETFNNIVDHSKSAVTGYSISQYNNYSNSMSLSVCDLGIGIITNVRQFILDNEGHLANDQESLTRSFQVGFTTKPSGRNGGVGLSNLQDVIRGYSNSNMRIVTNTQMLNIIGTNWNLTPLQFNFKGTCIDINVNCKDWEEDSEEKDFSL